MKRLMGCVLALVLGSPGWAEDRKVPPDKRSGTIVGVVTAKDRNWIEVKADGEEKARRYVPHWRGGLPKDGGGLDKKMLETFAKLKLNTRIKMEWEFEERPRAVKIEVLKEPGDKEPSKDK